MLKRTYALRLAIVLVLVVAVVVWLAGLLPEQAVQSEVMPSGPRLTKEDAIKVATLGMPDVQVFEAKLLYYDEARLAIGAGEKGNASLQKEPVWVVALRSEVVRKMPMSGDYTDLIIIFLAADGTGDSAHYYADLEHSEELKRLRALPDRTGQLEIVPRAVPTYESPLVPVCTPTAVPLVATPEQSAAALSQATTPMLDASLDTPCEPPPW